jgi:hypothetical protein
LGAKRESDTLRVNDPAGKGYKAEIFWEYRTEATMNSDERDELEDLLDGRQADLEARFRDLEQQDEIEQLRRQAGAAPRSAGQGLSGGPTGSSAQSAAKDPDPLAELKNSLDGQGIPERFLFVVCPHCSTKNRLSLTKVRRLTPLCGQCKKDLSFAKD